MSMFHAKELVFGLAVAIECRPEFELLYGLGFIGGFYLGHARLRGNWDVSEALPRKP